MPLPTFLAYELATTLAFSKVKASLHKKISSTLKMIKQPHFFNLFGIMASSRAGQSVESALITFAAIFWLIARILTIVDKKYRILTRRDKRESFLIVLQQNNI